MMTAYWLIVAALVVLKVMGLVAFSWWWFVLMLGGPLIGCLIIMVSAGVIAWALQDD